MLCVETPDHLRLVGYGPYRPTAVYRARIANASTVMALMPHVDICVVCSFQAGTANYKMRIAAIDIVSIIYRRAPCLCYVPMSSPPFVCVHDACAVCRIDGMCYSVHALLCSYNRMSMIVHVRQLLIPRWRQR